MYMSPELLLGQGYSPLDNDMFSIAVILFVMRSGAYPFFEKAADRDPRYNLIINQRSDQFWQEHEAQKGQGFYSEEFMDLVTRMMQFTPNSRLSIAEVMNHPWLQGEMATHDEIRANFTQRQIAVD